MRSVLTLFTFLICLHLFGCDKNNEMAGTTNDTTNTGRMKIRITIGKDTFTATLNSNATATAFTARLPMSINMTELNGNEKYFDLPDNLPANASNPGTIQTGDLMLYGSNTLVLFYQSFSTSYSYTPIGRIDNTSGLAAALVSGNVMVSFALQ